MRTCGGEVATTLWKVFYQAVQGYIQHGDLSRSAAIAFYTVTSLAPLLMASAGFPPTGSIRNSTFSTAAPKKFKLRHPETVRFLQTASLNETTL